MGTNREVRVIRSMTAFASRTGRQDQLSWHWEMRGVNGRGLDLRLRLPDGIDGLEQGLRAALSARLSRGAITLSLKIDRDAAAQWHVDEAQLDRVLAALNEVQARATAYGLTLAQSTAADVLSNRGVVVQGSPLGDPDWLAQALLDDAEALIASFDAMRTEEGAALAAILSGHLDEIGELLGEADAAAALRPESARRALREALDRIAAERVPVDEIRVAQELALLATRSDVTEEIDRLRAHLAAARTLMNEDAPVGRKLDFLTQEFMREANTLCAKAGDERLTRAGLALKAVIDRFREQVQNVE